MRKESVAFAAPVQMAVIYEALGWVRLMNASRHVFGMEGLCSTITWLLRKGVSDTGSSTGAC